MSAIRGFVRVLRSADLPACEGLESRICDVPVGNRTVLVGRLKDGRVVAFGPSCPHEATDLREATFVDGKVRCPRHNYIYDPHSGENVVPSRIARAENLWKLHPGYLPTYAVEVQDGWVWVKESPNPAPPTWDPAKEAPPPGGAPKPTSSEPPARGEPPAADKTTVEVPPKRLRVALGKEFELRLPMGAGAACTWRVDTPAGLLAVVAQQFEPVPSPHQRVRLAVLALGQGDVRCTFGRPWDPEPQEVRTYIVEVVPG